MKNSHTTGDTSAETDAVARLMSDVGIAFQMAYGRASSGGSGANTMDGVTVFPTYFKYANTISGVYRTNYSSDSAWMQVFRNEVQNGRPSQIRLRDDAAGAGHSVVVDGYRDSPSEQIHINFGWSGSYDGWYVTSNIVAGGYAWSNVNYQAAVIGITPTLVAVSLSPGKPSPQVAGTPIIFTAAATGGVAPYQYKWWVLNGTTWIVGQNWSSNSTFTWTPTAPGSYTIQAWAQNSGTTTDTPEAYQQVACTVTVPPPLSVTGLTPDKASPQAAGTPITFTATASGGAAPHQYKWWVFNGSAWSVGQPWGTSNTFTWMPTTPGTYYIQVWVLNSGTAADAPDAYREISYTVPVLSVTSLTADKPTPQPRGTSITFSALATGGLSPYQYKWWVFNGVSWAVARDWEPGSPYTWTPTVAGSYQFQVWVRNNGTTTDTAEASATIAFTIATASTVNLAAYQPQGWSDAIVVAAGSGARTDAGTYVSGQTYYLSVAVGNYGTGTALGRYYVGFYDNDVLIGTGYYDNHPAGYYVAWLDLPYAFSTAGTHVLKMVIDSTNVVPETNEADNVYSKALFVN
jgi:hypothetical protein